MLLRGSLLLASLTLSGSALAQPSQKPMQIIVPFAPGGSADGIARHHRDRARRAARPPGVRREQAGRRRHARPAYRSPKSPPDGDTLAVAATGALVINPHLPGSSGFDPLRELAPVAKLIDIPIVMVDQRQDRTEDHQGVIERSEVHARRIELRHHRREFQPAPRGRAAQEDDRRQSRPCPLSRQRAGGDRRARRANSARLGRSHLRRIRTSRPAR